MQSRVRCLKCDSKVTVTVHACPSWQKFNNVKNESMQAQHKAKWCVVLEDTKLWRHSDRMTLKRQGTEGGGAAEKGGECYEKWQKRTSPSALASPISDLWALWHQSCSGKPTYSSNLVNSSHFEWRGKCAAQKEYVKPRWLQLEC